MLTSKVKRSQARGIVVLTFARAARNFLARMHIVSPASDIQDDAEQSSRVPQPKGKARSVTVHLILLNQRGVGCS